MSAGLCARCSSRSRRNLGALRLCEEHYDAALAPIRARVMADESGIGHGRRVGPWRIDWGRHFAMLGCSICEAEWLGQVDEDCPWSVDRICRTVADQQRRVLRPELPDSADRRYDAAVTAWAQRLAVAVTAGIVDEFTARSALDKFRSRSAVSHVA